MADRGTAVFAATPAQVVVTAYAPLMPGAGDTVEPKRFLNVGGTAVPIQ